MLSHIVLQCQALWYYNVKPFGIAMSSHFVIKCNTLVLQYQALLYEGCSKSFKTVAIKFEYFNIVRRPSLR